MGSSFGFGSCLGFSSAVLLGYEQVVLAQHPLPLPGVQSLGSLTSFVHVPMARQARFTGRQRESILRASSAPSAAATGPLPCLAAAVATAVVTSERARTLKSSKVKEGSIAGNIPGVPIAAAGQTLYEACRNGRAKDAMRLLVELPEEARAAVAVNDIRVRNGTALSWACRRGFIEVVKHMLEKFPEEARNTLGIALDQSCRGGNAEVMRLLINAFPDTAKSFVGREFSEACRGKQPEVAKLLLSTFPQEVSKCLGEANLNDGTTALHWVCCNGLTRVLRLLLEQFPDEVNAGLVCTDAEGRTPLASACESNQDGIVQLMLSEFPDQSVPLPTLAPQPLPLQTQPGSIRPLPEMLKPSSREALERQNFRVIGSHSGVKQCRWTKHGLRGEGQCYKHTFYGISSHQCMEQTPSLACANKCTFCWRNHENPVTTSWHFQTDDPEWIVQESIRNHQELITQAATSPLALPERIEEARGVRHVALSLVGEPVLYPKIGAFIKDLHRRRISTFLVTNGQFPDELEQLPWVTQLYVSVDAPDAASLEEVGRPLFRDAWERLRRSLLVLRKKDSLQRTVCRMTLVRGQSMSEDSLSGYAELLALSDCDFVEVKAATWTSVMATTGLAGKDMPRGGEVLEFASRLAAVLPGYGIACHHEHSHAVLLARRDRFFEPYGHWRTWIDFEKFADAAATGNPLEVTDFTVETPWWALAGSSPRNVGFDPAERRDWHKPPEWVAEAQGIDGTDVLVVEK